MRGGDTGHRLHPEGVKLGDGHESEWLVGLGHDHLAVEDVVENDLVGEFGLVDGGVDLQLLDVVELLDDVLVGRVSDGAEEGRREELAATAAAVQVDVKKVVGVELHLHPGAAVGDDAEAVEGLAIEVEVRLETDTGRAVQLADDDPLGPVDDEGAAQGHHGQLTHVDALFLGAGFVGQREGHVERRAEGLAVAEGLQGGLLRFADLVFDEVQGELLVVTLNGENFLEDRLETGASPAVRGHILLQELFIGIKLHLDQIRSLNGLLDLAKIQTFKFLGSC